MSVAPRFHRLAVDNLRIETADAVSMTFAIPPGTVADDYSLRTPGQYLTLRTTMDGEESAPLLFDLLRPR